MSIWSDTDFLAAVEGGHFKATPWRPDDLTPNGLDLRLSHVQVLGRDAEPITQGTVTIPPGERFVLGTEAFLEMPVDAVGSLWIRSSYARRGVLASFGKVDAGFHGNLTVGCFNASHEAIEIPIGDRFCQIVMEDLKSPPQAAYAEKSGNYQGQTGVTLAK
ncbi:MAG: dCTP deaminase [Thermoplasmatota archaeon]